MCNMLYYFVTTKVILLRNVLPPTLGTGVLKRTQTCKCDITCGRYLVKLQNLGSTEFTTLSALATAQGLWVINSINPNYYLDLL